MFQIGQLTTEEPTKLWVREEPAPLRARLVLSKLRLGVCADARHAAGDHNESSTKTARKSEDRTPCPVPARERSQLPRTAARCQRPEPLPPEVSWAVRWTATTLG